MYRIMSEVPLPLRYGFERNASVSDCLIEVRAAFIGSASQPEEPVRRQLPVYQAFGRPALFFAGVVRVVLEVPGLDQRPVEPRKVGGVREELRPSDVGMLV